MSGSPFRVVLFNHNLRGVGTFYRCWHLAKGLGRLGLCVTLYTVSPRRRVIPKVEKTGNLTIVESPNLFDLPYLAGSGYGILGVPYRILRAAKDEVDIVHVFDHKPNVLVPGQFKRFLDGCPMVADWSDWWGISPDGSGIEERWSRPFVRFESALEELAHASADAVTTISSLLLDRAIGLGVPRNKADWIPSGAPSEEIGPLPVEACRTRLQLHQDKFIVGYLGTSLGDVDLVLDGIEATHDPSISLALIGQGKNELATVAESATLERLIPFGRVSFDVLQWYLGACDVLALPMKRNYFNLARWPNKFGDYLAAGRPVIVGNVGDAAQVTRRYQCGLICEQDPQDYARAIQELQTNKNLAREMGHNARRLAETDLSWQKIAERFLGFYERVT